MGAFRSWIEATRCHASLSLSMTAGCRFRLSKLIVDAHRALEQLLKGEILPGPVTKRPAFGPPALIDALEVCPEDGAVEEHVDRKTPGKAGTKRGMIQIAAQKLAGQLQVLVEIFGKRT